MNMNEALIFKLDNFWKNHKADKYIDGIGLVFDLNRDLDGKSIECAIQEQLFTKPYWNNEIKVALENAGYRCNVSSVNDVELNRNKLIAKISKDDQSIVIMES